MKNIYVSVFLSMFTFSAAHAADGTINFIGSLTDSTCSVSTSDQTTNVSLPKIGTNTLKALGNVAGRTAFKISLNNCAIGSVTAFFESGNTVDPATNRLTNQISNGAKNVQVQILNSLGKQIPISAIDTTGSQPNSEWIVVTTDKGGAILNFAAEYYATGAATAGALTTSVQYTLIYK